MMRRIDLLPASIAQAKRERQRVTVVVIAGMGVVLLLVLWWFSLGSKIKTEEQNLANAQATNQQLEAQIGELQEFALLEQELNAKRTALQTVFAGDVAWPSVMTELAMVVPGEVWLESLVAASGTTAGVGTESAPIDIAPDVVAVGRITFTGKALTMPGVAKWLIRLGTSKSFFAAYLSNASRGTGPDALSTVVSFSSTTELGPKAASERFLMETAP